MDAVTRRLIDLAVAELGQPARWETVPSSEVNSALVWLGPEHDNGATAYAWALAARVLDRLCRAGFPAYKHGAVATNPLFARSYKAWAAVARSWPRDPSQDRAPILVSLVVGGGQCGATRPPQPCRTCFARPAATSTLLRLLSTPWRTGHRRGSCATLPWSTATPAAGSSTSSAAARRQSPTSPAGLAWLLG
jgi:CBS domain-containing protein